MTSLEISYEELERTLNTLTGKEMDKIQKRALSGAGRILLKRAQKNAVASVPNVRSRNPKYSDSMYNAIRMKVFQEKDFQWYFKVHILGSRKKTSGTFRLRFFEGGTVLRKTKNPYVDKLGRRYPVGLNRGQIRGTNFFRSAVQGVDNEVVEAIQNNLVEEIKKITE